ncbi:MAG: sulfate ABC transporter permease subunit CysT [Planctomycetaceae bacterium]|nr:sulfate ABC transporter permease subunit CysT [Planctomycetaceae bacterium]
MANKRTKRHSVLPGFGLTMGFTVVYLSLMVLIPLAALFLKLAGMSWGGFWETISDSRVVSSFRVTFGMSLCAALVNAVFGFIVAWVLVRYTFPGRRIVDAMVDLPFALPTAVSGVTLSILYSKNGWIGQWFGFPIAYTQLGIFIALTFIGLPFVVRAVQPAIADIERELEEVAASLGASRWQTFWKVLFPALLPALLTGFTMAFARAIGEYGSVIFIAGNIPNKTEITPFLIVTKLESYDYLGATAIAVTMLVISFVLLLVINLLQVWGTRNLRET